METLKLSRASPGRHPMVTTAESSRSAACIFTIINTSDLILSLRKQRLLHWRLSRRMCLIPSQSFGVNIGHHRYRFQPVIVILNVVIIARVPVRGVVKESHHCCLLILSINWNIGADNALGNFGHSQTLSVFQS